MVEGIFSATWFAVNCWAMAIQKCGVGRAPRPPILIQSNAWNYCISQDAFAQPCAQVLRGQLRVAGQPDDVQPKPGSNRNVENKVSGQKAATPYEPVHLANFKVQVVRDCLYRNKWQTVFLGSARDRSGFHIHCMRSVRFCELLLLCHAGDFKMRREDGPAQTALPHRSLANSALVAAAILRVNDGNGKNRVADVQV